MRENASCMVFHVRWISHHSYPNPTLVATRLGRDSETRGEKNPSHKPYKMHIVSVFNCEVLTSSYPSLTVTYIHHRIRLTAATCADIHW